jgi:thioredoxin reductase
VVSVLISVGQSGLALGAELKNMGLKTLIVDKASRIGDGWRKRYDTVTTHSPTYADHYPFLKYPENWPSWLHRDKITSWMDHYAQIMGLDIKLNSNVKNIKYDQKKRHYRVEIDGSQTLTPRHLVLATGLFSNIPNYPEFHNQRTFRGHVYHSTDHKSAAQIPQVRNRKVSVIGAGTTAHDIAQDFVNCGAKEVSMIQHGPIFSLSSDSAEKAFFSPYKTLPTDIADMMSNSFPTPVKRTLGLGMTHMMAENDKTLLIGLEKAGLAVKRGEDGNSFIDYMLFKFGHFYIDQGASQMVRKFRPRVVGFGEPSS